MRMVLYASARTAPGSTFNHRNIASEATNTSTPIPAAPTNTRCHFARNAHAAEAST